MLPHSLTSSLKLLKYLKGCTEGCEERHKHVGLKEKETDNVILL